jgi:pectate lyase
MEGWAAHAGTTGGGDVAPTKVSSAEELRTLLKDETPRVLELEGTYDIGATYLAVGSNKTIFGKTKNTVVKGSNAVFSLRGSHNVILRNLSVIGGGVNAPLEGGGDAITATVADRLWFDHLSVSDGADGILDLTQGTTNVTISWCKIFYSSAAKEHAYAMQFSSGSKSGSTDKGKLDITMHHNWFGQYVNQRMPRHLWGKGHIYNSFYNSPGNQYCIGAGSLASLLIENNYFKDVADPFRQQDDGPVHIVANGNKFENTTGAQDTGALQTGAGAGDPPGPWTPPYKYTLDDAAGVPELVKRCSGPQ